VSWKTTEYKFDIRYITAILKFRKGDWMNIFYADTVSINYQETQKIIKQRWMGFSSSQTFRLAIDKAVDFVRNNKVRGIFNDIREQGAVDPRDVKYASQAMSIMFQNGIRAVAFIMPQKTSTQLSLNMFKNDSNYMNIKVFTNTDEALIWLESSIDDPWEEAIGIQRNGYN
jgi:hypothetical protein